MAIINLGSLNLDRVFRVPHIVAPGETIAAHSLVTFAGGKGANQSVAMARAGAHVKHVGKVGTDGAWLVEKLSAEGIDTSGIAECPQPTGQAIIQVDAAGENCIVLLGGANRALTEPDVDRALAGTAPGSWLLLQNETSAVPYAIRRGHELGLRVAFNPAPFDETVREYPLELVHLLCVNHSEGAALAGEQSPEQIVTVLAQRLPGAEILLSLGAQGVRYQGPVGSLVEPAPTVTAVDTTAAGDTLLGYFLACHDRGLGPRESLRLACHAAALCVARAGAMDSIPRWADVAALVGGKSQ
ncbi:MAG: ribokinase [Pirellulales bacterium]